MFFLVASSFAQANNVQTTSNIVNESTQSNPVSRGPVNRESILNQIAAITKMIIQLQAELAALNSPSLSCPTACGQPASSVSDVKGYKTNCEATPACAPVGDCPTVCGQSVSQVADGRGGKKTCAATSACAVSTATAIPGLTSISIGGGAWKDWTGDGKTDGPVIDIVYLDKDKDIISSQETRAVTISADVSVGARICASWSLHDTVYSQHYPESQIALGGIYPEIRIPQQLLNVGQCENYGEFSKSKYYWNGIVQVTIHTPAQGDFSASKNSIQLYKNLSDCPSDPCSNQ